MSEIGDYTFAPWKVVWREVSHTLDAAVTGTHEGLPTVPDHTIILVECPSEEEAHYLCGALNSAPARFAAQAYIVLHPDTHILDNIAVPHFDRRRTTHRQLAALSVQAHAAVARDDAEALAGIEEGVDQAAAELWDLTDADLTAIRSAIQQMA